MDSQILIRVNKGEYVGGDTIFGTVYLQLSDAVPSKTLKLSVRGVEISSYDYTYTIANNEDEYVTRSATRKGEKTFLKDDIRMIEYPRGFPKGCFSFPFQYQLPHGVPGVFSIRSAENNEESYEASIKYSIGAVLCNPQPRHKLQVDSSIIVYDSLDCRNADYLPNKVETSNRVFYLVCLNRGSVFLSTRLNKSAYCSDEVIKIQVEVRNQSSIDVSGVSFTLNRVLRLFGKDTERGEEELQDFIDFIPITTGRHDVIASGQSERWEECIDLKDRVSISLPPTTSGSIVRCRYHIDIKLHCKYSLDIDQVQEVIIKPSTNINWEKWEPPRWIHDCTVGPVTAPLGVPRDILYSGSFSTVPGFSN